MEFFLLQKAGRNRKASFFKARVKDTDGEGEHSRYVCTYRMVGTIEDSVSV